jgi:hypothetical protein
MFKEINNLPASIIRTKSITGKDTYNLVDNNSFLSEVFGFSKSTHTNWGVYLMGDFYVGASTNIRKRLIAHTLNCLNHRHVNKDFERRFIENLVSGNMMKILILSSNVFDEYDLIKFGKELGYPLVNSDSAKAFRK